MFMDEMVFYGHVAVGLIVLYIGYHWGFHAGVYRCENQSVRERYVDKWEEREAAWSRFWYNINPWHWPTMIQASRELKKNPMVHYLWSRPRRWREAFLDQYGDLDGEMLKEMNNWDERQWDMWTRKHLPLSDSQILNDASGVGEGS